MKSSRPTMLSVTSRSLQADSVHPRLQQGALARPPRKRYVRFNCAQLVNGAIGAYLTVRLQLLGRTNGPLWLLLVEQR